MFDVKKYKGLTESLASELLSQHGLNTIKETPPPSDFKILVQQLASPLVYVLIGAGVITLFLKELSDSLIIFVAVVVNTILSFFQERKANKALYALKKLITSKINVIRDGKIIEIDAKFIVPNDLVILNQGDKVPADGLILDANRLYVEEALLTGESSPIKKEKKDEVYMATIIASGRGIMKVITTGQQTKVGKIADQVQSKEEDTPLKKQLIKFSKSLAIIVLLLTIGVFLIGILGERGYGEMFRASVALAVSAIPEGLLVGLTVVLAIGMQRILKRRGLVRNLVSAETLGGVTTICLDKTGTLTQGNLEVADIVGDKKEIATQALVANDLDDPIVITANKWAAKQKLDVKKILEKYTRFDSIPFSASDRFFASLNRMNDQSNIIFVNGAPEILLKYSKLKLSEKEKIINQIQDLTLKGSRLIGLIKKEVSSSKQNISVSDVKDGKFIWVGMIAFTDPVRIDVSESLAKAKKAGIKLLIITGDYLQTALSVANKIDLKIDVNRTMVGEDLERLSTKELADKLKGENSIQLCARTTPSQKSKIVESLKLNGEVVAMMGDGVNDAPALKSADIGIVVNEASDVARETADLILLNSKFDTVISAIEEGRGIFDNIRKVIIYLMSTSFNAIIAVIGAILLGLPLPVTAAQILWINLISDGFPDLALTIDPKRKSIMDEPPRSTSEGLLVSWMKAIIGIVSLTSGILALILFIYVYKTTGNLALSQTVAFVSLGSNSLVYVFSIRTLREPIWSESLFINKWLIASVFAGFLLQITPLMFDFTRSFFGTVLIPFNFWILIMLISMITLTFIEAIKIIFKKRVSFV